MAITSVLTCGFATTMPTVTYATTNNTQIKYSINDLVKIVDPYIEESIASYKINNPNELKSKIGIDKFNALQKRLEIANKEKKSALNRDAVHDVHIKVLRAVGATVESHWWGKRIKTYNRTTAINVRKLANAFTGIAGDAGIVAALTATGIGFIPGIGTPVAIAGVVFGVVSWADSTTWNNVASKVANKIDEGKYNLTIDINAWIMDVQVY